MLKLKSIDENIRAVYNESDYYMKIRMAFEEKVSSVGVCYWNAYGLNRSLVELSIANPSGAIYDLAVPFLPVIHHQETLIMNLNVIEKIGFPLFETHWNEYQKGYYHLSDDNINFNIYAGKKNTLLLFSFNTVVLNVINGSVTFGFDADNDLCYIRIQNMALNDEGFLENI